MNARILLFIGLLIVLCLNKGVAQSFDYKENSAYVYNFIKYIDWTSKKTSITVGVIGNSPIEAELRSLVDRKKRSGIGLIVRNIDVSEAKQMDVVIVSEHSAHLIKDINLATAGLPLLIISEKENESRSGACISFFMNEENNFKTQYQLSVRNCRSRGLIVGDQIINNAILTR
jgi:YfiR/HmsC-like